MPQERVRSPHKSESSMIWQGIVVSCLIVACSLDRTLGENATEKVKLETMIWQRLLMAVLYLSQGSSHEVQLFGLRPEDVTCSSLEDVNRFTCKVNPERIQIYLFVTIKNYPITVRVLTTDTPPEFQGSTKSCDSGKFSFTLDDERYRTMKYYRLKYSGGDLDISDLIQGLLEKALNYQCPEDAEYEYEA